MDRLKIDLAQAALCAEVGSSRQIYSSQNPNEVIERRSGNAQNPEGVQKGHDLAISICAICHVAAPDQPHPPIVETSGTVICIDARARAFEGEELDNGKVGTWIVTPTACTKRQPAKHASPAARSHKK